MNIKKGDKVKILSGKDKGKTGKVLQVLSEYHRASVEGLNLLIKHMRPRKQGEQGQRIEFPAPINLSNLALICPGCNKPTRVGHKIVKSGVMTERSDKKVKSKKYRVCKKCQEVIS